MRVLNAALAVMMLAVAEPACSVGLELILKARQAEWEGRREEALASYAAATSADDLTGPQMGYVYSRMGAIRGYFGENLKAIDDYTKALQLDPKLGHAYSLRGYLRGLVGQYDLADRDHQAAVALAKDPVAMRKDPNPESYLSWTLQHYADLWRRRGEFARALEDCDRADRAAKLPVVAFRRAWIYFDMGEDDKAAAEFQKFLEQLKGQDPRPFWPDERRAITRLQSLPRSEP
jgi:tetratricopeptide (TPR) repeat protein